MKRYSCRLFVSMAMLTAGFAAHAVPVTYVLTPFVGATSTLTGSITIDDANTDNAVVLSEITDWQFSSVGGAYNFDFGKMAGPGNDNSAGTNCSGVGGACFTIVAGELVFDFGSLDPTLPSASFTRVATLNSSGGQQRIFDYRVAFRDLAGADGAGVHWEGSQRCRPGKFRPCPVDFAGEHTDYAERVTELSVGATGNVAEPGSLALLGLAGSALAWSQRRRGTRISTQ